jgi:hypothetical protein
MAEELNPSLRKFTVKQTRSLEVIAEFPGDAIDLARFVFRGDPIQIHIPAWSDSKIKIISLEVDESD